MVAKYTNVHNLPLSVAVWLAEDTYSHVDDPKHISATGLLKPIKQICLGHRVPQGDAVKDVASLLASKLGTAVHDSIENAWKQNCKQSLKDLGYPPGLVQSVAVNPPEGVDDDETPVYLETRTTKPFMGYNVSGEFDFCGDGRVEDFKSTSVFTYVNKTNDDKYIQQGSIYRWLNPEIITRDEMAIVFIFKDWSANMARAGGSYPPQPIVEYVLPLMSLQATEAFIAAKLRAIEKYYDAPEDDIPSCTDEDLWRSSPQWKYYADPAKATTKGARSTKNFANQLEANMFMTSKGKGIVVEKKGEVRACKYCPAAPICQQKNSYVADGSLKL